VKLHVHTLTPEVVLAKMREVGEFLTVKIENMSLQHSALEAGAAAEENKAPEDSEPNNTEEVASSEVSAAPVMKKYGIVAVTNGAGVEALFRDLGADATVSGGQTNNPSAQEFLEAFETISAENIFVFPNNSNIFLAAKQAAEIYEKAKIYVIPTKSIGTGYVALATLTTMELDSEEPDSILAAASEAIESVVCGAISPAIRDTQINGIEIKNGDTIGIIGKEIVVVDEDRDNAAFALADYMLKDGRYMMTIFRGKDATEEDAEKLNARITEKYPDVEVYTIDAGQDIYPYIIVAE
jgi:dihydroxyacetone kinase-like predicted kinase